MATPDPSTPDPNTPAPDHFGEQSLSPDRPSTAPLPVVQKKPRRNRWSVAGMAAAALLVAGGIGGVVADSVQEGTAPTTASSTASTGASGAFSAQTVAEPATLAEALDHVHDGITVPEEDSATDGSAPSGENGSGQEYDGGSSGSSLGSPGSSDGGEEAPSGPDGFSFGGPGASFGDDGPQGTGEAATGVDAGVEVQDAPGTLLVNTESSYGEGAGTGMVLRSDGLAMTNYHVVDGSSEVEVTVADTGETYTASVVGRDATHDVAVLQVQDASDLETVSVDASGVDTGEEVAAVGNGSGQGYLTAVSGTITGQDQSISAESIEDTEDLTGLIETDADVVPGYSGGPLVDDDGQIIGMSTAASTGRTSEQVNGYAIGITEALDIADQIAAGTESDSVQVGASGALGVTVENARSSQATGAGAVIVDVSPGSAAESAGLAAGDVISAVDGTEVSDASELSEHVQSMDPGDTVDVEWTDAAGEEHSATVELDESTVN
ncbi:S1C family serine protease [Citricoccus sp. GCM10030269]|uniref:S1C family serine protease n=1 Tax=Citricoccus sp. GCM10030269 TaxID=3273388 RepID=UPI00360EDBFA